MRPLYGAIYRGHGVVVVLAAANPLPGVMMMSGNELNRLIAGFAKGDRVVAAKDGRSFDRVLVGGVVAIRWVLESEARGERMVLYGLPTPTDELVIVSLRASSDPEKRAALEEVEQAIEGVLHPRYGADPAYFAIWDEDTKAFKLGQLMRQLACPVGLVLVIGVVAVVRRRKKRAEPSPPPSP